MVPCHGKDTHKMEAVKFFKSIYSMDATPSSAFSAPNLFPNMHSFMTNLGNPPSSTKIHVALFDTAPLKALWHYSFILDMMRYKLSGWAAKSLSLAGRITLIKSILSATPVFFMQTMAYESWRPRPSKVLRAHIFSHENMFCSRHKG
ncbi:hypothetical protein V6N12_045968 [Hibiscus sabdariffa]|uniref:Uncharacterized protein n=1 Tax=Hibiscus sabdariffa TaxID=183260 RepID=A0ABR2G4B1_9ROSI